MYYLRQLWIALLLMVLAACSGTAPRDLTPWEMSPDSSSGNEPSREAVSSKPDYGPKLAVGQPYEVNRGDTLYAIAFRLGMDFRELAALNGIKAPFTINVGQVLNTSKPTAVLPTRTTEASGSRKPRTTGAVSPKTTGSASIPKQSDPGATKSRSQQTAVAKKVQPPKQVPSSPAVESNRSVSRWRWPSKGKVIRTFAANVHKGIDIEGRRGDPVLATAAGKVVYAGAGVTGYGSLIIVKHNDTYLSAYGHNEQLLVSEGSVVKVGQQIATMGSSGTNSVKLHFELRRLGKPVDPLTLLPKR